MCVFMCVCYCYKLNRTVRTSIEQYRTFDSSNFEKKTFFELLILRTYDFRTSNFEFKYQTCYAIILI